MSFSDSDLTIYGFGDRSSVRKISSAKLSSIIKRDGASSTSVASSSRTLVGSPPPLFKTVSTSCINRLDGILDLALTGLRLEPIITEQQFSTLPSEILLTTMKFMSSHSLLMIRCTSKHLLGLANEILAHRLKPQLTLLQSNVDSAREAYLTLKSEKDPHLVHYRSFLTPDHSQVIKEATWYSTPPAELKAVCECLCILGYGGKSNFEDSPMLWTEVKKMMGRFDFKNWFRHIEQNVQYIPMKAVRRVEDIIRNDPLITYERLREVSTAGYALLIVVAACLQYMTIQNDLNSLEDSYKSQNNSMARKIKFMFALSKSI